MSKLKVKWKRRRQHTLPVPSLGVPWREDMTAGIVATPQQIELWSPGGHQDCNQADLSIISLPGLPPLMSLSASVCPKRAGGKTSWQPPGPRATKTAGLPSADTRLPWSDLPNVTSPTQWHTWQGTGRKEGRRQRRICWRVRHSMLSLTLEGAADPRENLTQLQASVLKMHTPPELCIWCVGLASTDPLSRTPNTGNQITGMSQILSLQNKSEQGCFVHKVRYSWKMWVDLPTIKHKGWSSHQEEMYSR